MTPRCLAAAVLASIALAYLWLKLWDDHVRQYPQTEPYSRRRMNALASAVGRSPYDGEAIGV